MFSGTPPPILPPEQIPLPKTPAQVQEDMEGVKPNLPEGRHQTQTAYIDASIEEIALELMREQIPAQSSTSTRPGPSAQATSSSFPPSTAETSTSPHTPSTQQHTTTATETELEGRRHRPSTPPALFSTRSSVPAGDPTAQRDKQLGAAKLEDELNGHGIAKGLMSQPEGKGGTESPEEEDQRRKGRYSDDGNWRRGRDNNGGAFS